MANAFLHLYYVLNRDRLKITICVKYFHLLCTNASYWFVRNGIIETKIAIGSDHLPVRWHLHFAPLLCRSYRFSKGYIGEYKCTVIGLCLLFCLQFFSRLRRRIQVYCYRYLFTNLSTVFLLAT